MYNAQGEIMYVNKIVVIKYRFVNRGINFRVCC
jgi:hypothetical protein